ncbi:hypothetical protein [Methylobacterium tarhaniae]|uniref:hypothetical protein n=1 Tax=Methylobacterium tarhaniae TaxID=1187852 RepID=UPI003CFE79A3
MTDRPIIFSGPMVRALLAGTKTQTRRILAEQPASGQYCARVLRHPEGQPSLHAFEWRPKFGAYLSDATVRYAAGDRLYVREAWAPLDALTHDDPGTRALAEKGFYRADEGTVAGEISKWRPSIHMPRWASRLTLTVTEVRVQRLQDISEADARAEGCGQYASSTPILREFRPEWKGSYRQGFLAVWDQLHGTESTDADPWVAAISFRVIPANIDSLPEQP